MRGKGGAMRRREFIAWLTGGAAPFPALWPLASRGQAAPPAASAAADNSIGQVASMTGSATVTRGNAARAVLKVADVIYAKDILQTEVNSSLGITFDDETTFSLSANTRIVIDSFVYQEGGHGNLASFNVAAGTASFIANLVAKTGDMKIATPEATLGIRGTTGIVEVAAGWRRRRADGQALSRRRRACRPHRGLQSARRVSRRAHARRERLCVARWSGRPHRRGAVSDSRGRSGARSRRLATPHSHAHDRPPDADPAAALTWTSARTWPARSKQSASARRSESATRAVAATAP